jgi:hypothetical protein
MENKIISRLKDLYKHRTEIEKKLVISLRYTTKDEQIQESINNLSEMRGRIQELEYVLTQEQVNVIKTELGMDFW